MTDILDVVYRLRDMAGKAADRLRGEIAQAQQVLDRLDRFAADAEATAELAAASDLFPDSCAIIPARSGMVRPDAEGYAAWYEQIGAIPAASEETQCTSITLRDEEHRLVRCILVAGHSGGHTDGAGASWTGGDR